jgi:hypothetical protein
MMARSASSNQRPDRLMRTACPSEDSSCNARPVHRWGALSNERPYRELSFKIYQTTQRRDQLPEKNGRS